MFYWMTALLSTLLSLGGLTPDTVVGTARMNGIASVNGHKVNGAALLVDGDRLETGPGVVAALNLSPTDRLIVGERSSIILHAYNGDVSAEVINGRLQVNTTQQRLREVRLTDEGISIRAPQGQVSDFMVTRLEHASYVLARRSEVTITDEGYGGVTNVPEGKVGTIRTEMVHIDPPAPQQTRPISTGTSGARAGSVTAILPAGYIERTSKKDEASKGAVLNIGDTVSSNEKGRMRMVLDDGSILNLGSSSSMKIIIHDAKSRNSDVLLTAGRVRAQVRAIGNATGKEWTIHTNTAVCGVLGTDFFVETDGGKTRLVVFQGKVSFMALTQGVAAAGAVAINVIAGQTSTSVAGAVASPVASGTTASTAAAASTAISGQGATAAGQAAIAASRVGVTTAATVPTSATAAVLGTTVANGTAQGQQLSNINDLNGTITTVSPH